jgi:hypothetical protein
LTPNTRVLIAVSFSELPQARPERTSSTVWERVDGGSEFLVLIGFKDEEAASENLRLFVEQTDALPADPLPLSVDEIAVEFETGSVLDDVPLGSNLGQIRSMARLGYGQDLRERIEEFVAGFEQFPSYLGHLLGSNKTLEDQVWNFVFTSEGAPIPMPEEEGVDARIFRRIA